MERSNQAPASSSGLCEWCYNIGTSRCGRCRSVFYCSREHQIAHWPNHKKNCKQTNQEQSVILNPSASNSLNFATPTSFFGGEAPYTSPPAPTLNAGTKSDPSFSEQSRPVDFQMLTEEEIFSSLSRELLGSDNNVWDLINECDVQNLLDPSAENSAITKISETLQESAATFTNSPTDTNLMQSASLVDICNTIIHDMNEYGICVLDKFIGIHQGSLILDEVKNLYRRGVFQKGELATPNLFVNKESIRSDVTTWISGREPDCYNIGSLMRKLDLLLISCNKSNNNGILSSYSLSRRTKAMIACYPGDGTHYKRHVDNPSKDGRCITCIYYLNKDWDVARSGGVLRMFPVAQPSRVANIEPIFDRVIFFWSDKRNPHEVLPAFDTRFAITVWYFDAAERERALASQQTATPSGGGRGGDAQRPLQRLRRPGQTEQ